MNGTVLNHKSLLLNLKVKKYFDEFGRKNNSFLEEFANKLSILPIEISYKIQPKKHTVYYI